ncbi:MAG: hypothetical protein K9J06_05375 [Flavobacteriales bacterium]|nr:hypothetical protein [Flavobacteriales bacterium]
MVDFITNYGIILTYILLAVAVVTAVGFPLIQLAKNPKGAKGALIGAGLLVVVVGISYALSSPDNPSNINISPEGAKQVDTGLYAFYMLAAVAVVVTVYAEVSKLFK